MAKELFKPLHKVVNDDGVEYNFDGQVCASNKGKIFVNPRTINKSAMNGYFAKGRKTEKGYYQIGIMDSTGKRGWFYIHSLMANAWLERKPNQKVVMHIDDNPANNVIENLVWGTQLENMHDMIRKGRHSVNTIAHTDAEVIEIFNKRQKGVKPKELMKQYPHIKKSYMYHITAGNVLKARKIL